MNKDNIGNFTTSQLNGLMKDLKKLNIAAESNWGDDWMHTDRPAIWIHAEGVTDETTYHLDYYEQYEGTEEIQKIFTKHEAWVEWQNPAVANIYKM